MQKKPACKRLNYNCRMDEQGNPNGFQISFRANRKTSAKFASCCGLIKKYGPKGFTMIDLFEQVVLPAVQNYCSPLADKAREERGNSNK